MISSTDVKQRYPELAAVSDNVINLAITDTTDFFDLARWGNFYTKGHCALVAHIVFGEQSATLGASAKSGALSGQSADGVSVSYAVYTPLNYNESYYMSTPYGATYLSLVKIVGSGATCVCGA